MNEKRTSHLKKKIISENLFTYKLYIWPPLHELDFSVQCEKSKLFKQFSKVQKPAEDIETSMKTSRTSHYPIKKHLTTQITSY